MLLIAKTRDQQRWRSENMGPDEQAVWNDLGIRLNAQAIYDHLGYHVKEKDRDELTQHRFCDFSAARDELRKSLFAGETVAYFQHEDGKLDHVLKDGWGGDEAEDILLKGLVCLEGGLFQRVILLRKKTSKSSLDRCLRRGAATARRGR